MQTLFGHSTTMDPPRVGEAKNLAARALLEAMAPVLVSHQDLQRMREREIQHLKAGHLPPNWTLKPD